MVTKSFLIHVQSLTIHMEGCILVQRVRNEHSRTGCLAPDTPKEPLRLRESLDVYEWAMCGREGGFRTGHTHSFDRRQQRRQLHTHHEAPVECRACGLDMRRSKCFRPCPFGRTCNQGPAACHYIHSKCVVLAQLTYVDENTQCSYAVSVPWDSLSIAYGRSHMTIRTLPWLSGTVRDFVPEQLCSESEPLAVIAYKGILRAKTTHLTHEETINKRHISTSLAHAHNWQQ